MRAYSVQLSTMQWVRLRNEVRQLAAHARKKDLTGILADLDDQITLVLKHDDRHHIPYEDGLPQGWKEADGPDAQLAVRRASTADSE
jgi:hypothetical protein